MDRLNEWLSLNKIGYIISIDDLHNKEIDSFSKIIMLKNGLKEDFEKYSTPFKHIESIWENISNYKDNIDNLIEIYKRIDEDRESEVLIEEMDNLIEEQKKPYTLIEDLVEKLKKINQDPNNSIKECKIYDSYEDVINDYDSYLSTIDNANNRVLWLVDFELEGKSSNRNGIELIKQILKDKEHDSTFVQNNIFIILSSQMDESHNLEDIYRKIYVIDKKSLINKIEFAEKLIIGSKSYISSVLVGDIVKRLMDGLKSAKEKLLEESLEILDYLLVSYPHKEGTHPIELLLRIFSIISKSEFEDSMSVDVYQIFNLLNEYELMYSQDKEKEKKSDFINKCFKREKYNENINLFHSSITSGDIFKINNKYYILVTQPCDIAIRDNGERNSKHGILLEMIEGDTKKEFIYPLYYFRDEPYHIDFKHQKYINLEILDLCTLCKDGYAKLHIKTMDNKYKSILDTDNLDEEKISLYFKELLNQKVIEGYLNKPNKIKIFNVFRKIFKSFQIIDKLKRIIAIDDHYIIEQLINSNDELIGFNNFSVEDDYIKFDVQRAANLNSIVTSDIISKFSNYTSRIGKPGVFAEGVDNENSYFEIFIEELNSGEEKLIEKIELPTYDMKIKENISAKYGSILNTKNINNLDIRNNRIKIAKDLQVVNIENLNFSVKVNKNNCSIDLDVNDLIKIKAGQELMETLEQITVGIEQETIKNIDEYARYYDIENNTIRSRINFPYKTDVNIMNNTIKIISDFNKESMVNEGKIIIRKSED